MCRVPENKYRLKISAVGLERFTLRVVTESQGWGPAPYNQPLSLEDDVFVGEVRLNPGDMALIRAEGPSSAVYSEVISARMNAGVHQPQGDDYSGNAIFLAIPGWDLSSRGMPYPYSVVPEPQDQAA